MGMLTFYNAWNRHVSKHLTIRYQAQPFASAADGSVLLWSVTRYAAKEYGFYGMTASAARDCARAKLAQYTRAGLVRRGDTYDLQPGIVMASVEARPEGGGNQWMCGISVNETDTVVESTAPTNPASLFSQIAGRDYDGGAGGDQLMLLSASLSGGTLHLDYRATFDVGNGEGVSVQYKATETTVEWSAVSYSSRGSSSYSIDLFGVELAGGEIVRLVAGGRESNAVTI